VTVVATVVAATVGGSVAGSVVVATAVAGNLEILQAGRMRTRIVHTAARSSP
jgi:hypothetical protein